HEGDEVKKGQLLFRTDHRLQREQLKEAEADLRAAQATLAKVERAQKVHAEQVKAQKFAVKAAENLAAAQASEGTRLRKWCKQEQINREELTAGEKKGEAAEDKVKAEKAKLGALEAYDFTPELDLARANIDAKKAVAAKARLAVEECEVFAPED